MKLTFLLLLVFSMQITASVSMHGQVTLKMQNESIRDVFKEIETQSPYRFFYNEAFADLNKRISINVDGKDINSTLDEMLLMSDMAYRVLDNNLVVIAPRKELQQHVVTGSVTDAGTGEPLPGVSIIIQGTTTGTITNPEGNYSIAVPDQDAVLVFSFVGYSSREMAVGNRTTINVELQVDAIGIDEVVAIGYGTQRRGEITASISTVLSEQLSDRPITSSTQALQGVKGIYVNQMGAQPGRSLARIRIRGQGTLNNNDPLVVVDGIESSLDNINFNDIENISVMKDAAAAAIYGSRAASGVVLVTTKSGERIKGFHVNYSSQFGLEEVIGLPNFITHPIQGLELANQAKLNAGETPWYSQEFIEEYREGMNTDPIVYPHNDWFDIMFDAGILHNHNLRFSGGEDNYNYSLSLGYMDHKGVLIGTNSNTYSIALNTDANITDKLSVGFKFSGQLKEFDEAVAGSNRVINETFKNAGKGWQPTYDRYGRYGDQIVITPGHHQFRNPLAKALEGINNHNNKYYHIILSGKYDLPGNFTYNIQGSYAKSNDLNTVFEPAVLQYNVKTGASKRVMVHGPTVRRGEKSLTDNYNLDFHQTLEWEKSFIESHNIYTLIGYEMKEFNYNNIRGYQEGYLGNTLYTLNAGSTAPRTWGTDSRHALMSFFYRLQYDYNRKYLFQGNFRYDGSSRFGEGQKWGLFPSFSAGWRIGQEDFLREIVWMDDLKIRASWGQLGNERVPSFRYVNLVNTGYNYSFGNTVEPGAAITSYNDPRLTWETTTISNIGIDVYLQRMDLSFEVFKKRTSDILHAVSIPTQVGNLSGPLRNIGVVDNKGYELSLSYRNSVGPFSYELSGAITRIKNEVVDLNEEIIYKYGARGQGGTIIKEGYPIDSYYMLRAIGIFNSQEEIDNHAFQSIDTKPGYIKFEDVNNDGIINEDDRVIMDKNRIPNYTGLFNLSLSYKNINLSAFFNGVEGVYTFRAQPGDVPFWYGTGVTRKWVENSWTPDNMNAKLPILTTYEDAVNTNFRPSDFLLHNASYLRLKNLQISYNLPAQLIDRLNISSARVFVNGQNLWTLTEMDTFDPERNMDTDNSFYDYPSVKTFTGGININF